MKAGSVKISLLLGLALVMTIYSTFANQDKVETTYAESSVLVIDDVAPVVSAKAYAVFDVETGQVIASYNADKVLPIASVTKLVTAATVIENLEAEKKVTITDFDVDAYGRAGRLETGDVYTNYELLFPLLLESSNDAAAVYERETSGDIVGKMNSLVETLGASQTHFTDASGLSDRNVSTVSDLTKILQTLHQGESHIFDITRLSKKMGQYVGWVNNNPVWQEDYLGGKHGFTEAAGKTLAGIFSDEISGRKVAVGYVLLGSKDLVADTEVLRIFVHDSVRFE